MADTKNPFLQNISLVLIGAIISFASSLATNYFNSKSESNRIALEEELKCERDVAESVSSNISASARLTNYETRLFVAQPDHHRIGIYDLKQVDSATQSFANLYESLELRTLTVEFLSSAYVDPETAKRLKSLDSMTLDNYADQFDDFRAGLKKCSVDTLYKHCIDFKNKNKSMLPLYKSFMPEFHEAILK